MLWTLNKAYKQYLKLSLPYLVLLFQPQCHRKIETIYKIEYCVLWLVRSKILINMEKITFIVLWRHVWLEHGKVANLILNTGRKWLRCPWARHLSPNRSPCATTKMTAHCFRCVPTVCSMCVFTHCSYCVCTNLDGLNAEDKFQVWVTILGLHMSLHVT